MKYAVASAALDGDMSEVTEQTLRDLLGYNIKRAFNVIQTDLTRALKPHDLRMITFSALVLIVDNPGLRQSQLADALALERPNLVGILDGLEARALITRDRVPTDRRAYSLQATLAGRQLSDAALRDVQAHEIRLLAGLTETERAQVIAAMRLVEQGRKRSDP
jgi:DNA-binding MarR family transcriptional regulator